jgi:glycosyltransferase involved in cell wall biosynthesis
MTETPVLSVLMPVYNERDTLRAAIDHLELCDFGVPMELIVVDDGSTDGSRDILRERVASAPWIRAVYHERNGGKGAAVRTGLGHARGRFTCIYDADLEYDPNDMEHLLRPLIEGRAEVAYGIRAFGGHAAYSYWYVVGNRMLTLFSNVMFNTYVRDIMTCFKMMPTDVFRSLDIRSNGFDLEAEITGKLLAHGYRIFEVPISYKARTYEEGKKIQLSDGWKVLWTLTKLRFFHPRAPRASRGIPERTAVVTASNGNGQAAPRISADRHG